MLLELKAIVNHRMLIHVWCTLTALQVCGTRYIPARMRPKNVWMSVQVRVKHNKNSNTPFLAAARAQTAEIAILYRLGVH